MRSPTAGPVKIHSVFFQLILSFVIIVALIAGGLQGIFYLISDGEWETQPNWKMALTKYAWYMSNEIGNPPDLEKAKTIAEENSLGLMIVGPNINWKSDPNLEIRDDVLEDLLRLSGVKQDGQKGEFDRRHGPPERRFKKFYHPRLPISIQRGKGKLIVQVLREPYNFVFVTEPPLSLLKNPWLIFATLAWIGFVLMLFYWRVRRIFNPLRTIQKGFEQLGDGNFHYQIEEVGRHEFKFLFESFNRMSERLLSLWQGQRRLLRDMSHELRTPLTRMKLSLAMLPESKYKAELEENVNELSQIILTILEAEKLESGVVPEFTEVSLIQLLQATIVKQKKLFANRRIELLAGEDLFVHGNSTLLEIAFSNLLNNALKYSSDAVTVKLMKTSHSFVTIEFQDFGGGLSDEDQKKVFTPFFRAKDTQGQIGNGLGLNLTKRIVLAHKGSIELQSRLGKGTTVAVQLPI